MVSHTSVTDVLAVYGVLGATNNRGGWRCVAEEHCELLVDSSQEHAAMEWMLAAECLELDAIPGCLELG